MKTREAQGLFKESELLYRERRYDEALGVLQRLDEKYPNTRNILYPIAKCLRRLGRFDEAAATCDRLVLEFDDERATHMRKNLDRAIHRAAAQTVQVAAEATANFDDELDAGFDPLDLGELPPLDEEAPTVHLPGGYRGAKRVQESNPPWLYIGIGAAVVILVLVIAAAMLGGGSGDQLGADAAVTEEISGFDTTQFNINFYLFWVFATLATYWIALYVTLTLSDKLPYMTFSDNALNVFGFSMLCGVIATVLPCLGLIINIVILRKRYDMTFLNFLTLVGISSAATIPFIVLFLALFWGSFVELAEIAETPTN